MLKKRSVHSILIILILIIVGSALWSPGGILLLDYMATPHWDGNLMQNAWFLIPQIPVSIFGFSLGTKITFVAILMASAYLGMLFGRFFSEKYTGHSKILEVIGGAFFLLNPFAYERMMVQPVIYLGIILLGYLLYSLLVLFGWRKWILSGIFAGFAWNLFLHASYMMALILGLYILFFVRSKKDILGVVVVSGIILFLNANWLLAPLFAVSNSTSTIGTFDIKNLEAFMTQSLAPMNVWFTNILLYGFWGEKYANHYANVGFLSTLWYVAGGILLVIMGGGEWRLWSEKGKVKSEKSSEIHNSRRLVWFLGLIGVFSLIFGIGIASPLTRGLTEWMIAYVPLWQGYREPQKWIGILMLVEGIFLIIGVGVLLQKYGKDVVVQWSLVASIAVLFLVWSPGPLMGYHGQLRTTVYPREFENLRNELQVMNYKGRILALPWHSYLGCSWTGRPTIANPIQGLLSPLDVIVADNIEAGPWLYSNSQSDQSKKIESFLKTHAFSDIAGVGIDSILLMKQCATSDTYEWLNQIQHCKKITDNPVLSYYQCQK